MLLKSKIAADPLDRSENRGSRDGTPLQGSRPGPDLWLGLRARYGARVWAIAAARVGYRSVTFQLAEVAVTQQML